MKTFIRKKRIARSSGGFTLVETLVAIAVMMAAFTGPVVIARQAVQSAIYAKDQIAATFLAEEGIEIVRNIRDNNFLGGLSFTNGLGGCTTGCTVDAFSSTLTACPLAGCPAVKYDPTSGSYGTNPAWSDSPFTRTVTITSIDANQILIQSSVSWNLITNRQITIKEILFNWQ